MRQRIILAVAFLLLSLPASALDVNDLRELVGYTLVEITSVPGEFEGADYDKVVKLSNGMFFEFTTYSYSYSYAPDVAIFARKLELKQQSRTLIVYKLVVEDEIYEVTRVR